MPFWSVIWKEFSRFCNKIVGDKSIDMNHFFRRQTNLDFVERNPLKHNYLLKKPKTHEPSEASLSRESTGENEAQIDDPVREKRKSFER